MMPFNSRRQQRTALALLIALVTVPSCRDNGTDPLTPDHSSTSSTATSSSSAPKITNLRAKSGASYVVDASLAVGDRRYSDKTYKIAAPLPKALAGQVFIRTAYNDGNSNAATTDFVTFDVDRDVEVYVSYYDKASLPAWLESWKDSGYDLQDDKHGAASSMYVKKFSRGTIRLGGSPSGVMYTVIVVPTSAPEPVENPPAPKTPSGALKITSLRAASGQQYEIDTSIATGDRRYIDRAYEIAAPLPSEIAGKTFIRTAYSDGNGNASDLDFLAFDVDRDVTVYVSYYDKAMLPAWLSSWTDSGLDLVDNKHGAASSLYKKSFKSGTVKLGGSPSGVMYTVVVVPTSAPAPVEDPPAPKTPSGALKITSLRAASGQQYEIDTSIATGDRRYIDRAYEIAAPLPAAIAGKTFIRTAYSDGNGKASDLDFLAFDVDRDVTVYVSYYDKAMLPAWLSSWTDSGLDLVDNKHGAASSLYKKSFKSGTVELGGSPSGVMYTVVVDAAAAPPPTKTSDIQPPTVPTGLKAATSTVSPAAGSLTTMASQPAVELNWKPSTDNVGVSGYQVLRDGVVVDTVPSVTYADVDLVAGKKYMYQVTAYDAAKNVSGRSAAVVATISVQVPGPAPQGLRAFPGAEGFGAKALAACRGLPLQVLTVTHAGNSGAGSFREALAAAKPNHFTVIKFDVSGYIQISGRIVNESQSLRCLYVAGQTAPGDGVNLGAPSGDFGGILLDGKGSADQVWRHLRFRLGAIKTTKGIAVASMKNAMFDHLSISWGGEKAMAISPSLPDSTVDITISRSIFAETSALHPTAMQVTGQERDRPSNARVALLRNYFTGNSYRNPVLAAWHTLMLNNLVYNWNFAATKGPGNAAISEADVINNFYMPGPMTGKAFQHAVVVECTRQGNPNPAYPDISLHVRGNVGPTNSDPFASHQDQTTGPNRVTSCYYRTAGVGGEPVPTSYQPWRSSRLPLPQVAPVELLATQVPTDVLGDVGSNAGVSCTGDWFRRSDPVDHRLISEYHSRTGVKRPPLSAADVGGFPNMTKLSLPCADSDKDGLPNAWEARYPAASNPAADTDGDGYLNIEEFINGTNPLVRN
jgi:hypothetical protein